MYIYIYIIYIYIYHYISYIYNYIFVYVDMYIDIHGCASYITYHIWIIHYMQNQDKSCSSWLATPTLSRRPLTGCTWITWQIAAQLLCFRRNSLCANLKYDPPRRPREMRIIDPRRSMMLIYKTPNGKKKNLPPPDALYIIVIS